MTIHRATQQLVIQLFDIYEEREARNIANLVMERITEWKRIDRILNKEVPLSPEKQALLESYTRELLSNKPVQYVLNEAWFSGMKFYVNEHVLIPRPETEELVDWIISDLAISNNITTSQLKILDVGTGSGCIAIALQKKLPQARVYACDISERALEIAQRNALENGTSVHFIKCDILNPQERNSLPRVDVIVSNPPYVPLQNKPGMRSNVADFEPSLALFVPDTDPLLFYHAIAELTHTHLSVSGAVYVEIHEEIGNAVTAIFRESGFENIQLKRDLQQRDRMVKALNFRKGTKQAN